MRQLQCNNFNSVLIPSDWVARNKLQLNSYWAPSDALPLLTDTSKYGRGLGTLQMSKSNEAAASWQRKRQPMTREQEVAARKEAVSDKNSGGSATAKPPGGAVSKISRGNNQVAADTRLKTERNVASFTIRDVSERRGKHSVLAISFCMTTRPHPTC